MPSQTIASLRVSLRVNSRPILPIIGFALLCLVPAGRALGQAAELEGNTLHLHEVVVGAQRFSVGLRLLPESDPLAFSVIDATELSGSFLDNPNRLTGTLLEIPALSVDGMLYWVEMRLQEEPELRLVVEDFGPVSGGSGDDAQSCTRPEPDPSHGPDDPEIVNGFSVSTQRLMDGGPAPDGIPSIDTPVFWPTPSNSALGPDQLVVGVILGGTPRAYSHHILNWHEIVNQNFLVDEEVDSYTLSFCPLTGSAMLWRGVFDEQETTFGTSGLVMNSNLVLYDRQTRSLWSQMLEQSINGPNILKIPERVQVIETTWATWLAMYPDTELLTEFTGVSRPYDRHPYGDFPTNERIMFPVDNLEDDRLHIKERVVGINVGEVSKVYPIDRFGDGIAVLNDRVGAMDVVAVGSGKHNFGAVYDRQMADCTTLDFSPLQNQLPIVMTDNEGNRWDVFGKAVSGPRAGESLQKTNSYIAYWFAWTAFFPGATIHQ